MKYIFFAKIDTSLSRDAVKIARLLSLRPTPAISFGNTNDIARFIRLFGYLIIMLQD